MDMANVIGLTYIPGAIESISAGAGFVFSYYAYLGNWSPVICILLTLTLDGALVVYTRLTPRLLVPAMVGVALALLSMIQGDFTVGLVTHGLIPGLVLAAVVNSFDRSFHALRRTKMSVAM